jgi:CRP/FNR family transcriptional regulator, cyclic AMP receptor protein
MAVRDQELVQLLDAWPDLGDLLTPAERAAARQALVLRSQRAPKGQWMPGAEAGPVTCLLVLDGLLIRDAVVGDVHAPELLGTGDVVHLAADATEDLLGTAVVWTTVDDARVAWIGASTFATLARWPALQSALIAQATQRSRRQAAFQAICHHVRCDARIVGLLWHLAERWGRVTPAGVIVPLRLTHDAIAAMIGAQRPTVSTALGALANQGVVERRDDGAWILRLETNEEIARIFTRTRSGRSPDAQLIHEEPLAPPATPEDHIERVTST